MGWHKMLITAICTAFKKTSVANLIVLQTVNTREVQVSIERRAWFNKLHNTSHISHTNSTVLCMINIFKKTKLKEKVKKMFQSVDLILLFYYFIILSKIHLKHIGLYKCIFKWNYATSQNILNSKIFKEFSPAQPAFIWFKINNYSSLPCHMILYKSL